MARKVIDKTKSATFNEGAINDNFEELYESEGGITLDDLKAQVTTGKYGSNINVGGNVDYPTLPSHLIEDVNTIRMIKDMKDSVLNVSGEYGHEANMVIHNGKAYIAYMYQAKGTGESWESSDPDQKPRTKLSIVNLSTMQVESTMLIAGEGSTYTLDGETRTINVCGSPNIAVINGVVRVLLVDATGNAQCILYRDYNISTGTLGTLSVCYISNSATTKTATKAHFSEMFETSNGGFGVNGQYAKIGDTYYIAVVNGESGKNGHIFTTTDFITYTFWAKPSIPAIGENLGFEFEMAIYPWIDPQGHVLLYFAMRRSKTLKNMIVGTMYTGLLYYNGLIDDTEREGHESHTAGKVKDYKIVPCNSSRPCFFSKAGSVDFDDTRKQTTIYLAYDNVQQPYAYREITDITYLRQGTFEGSYVGRIAQCLTMTYPSIQYYDGYYYVAYQGHTTGSQPHVLFSRFRPFSANWDKVIAGLSKMLDTFEPSNT